MTRRQAETIARKLDGKIRSGGKHMWCDIRRKGQVVVSFGIRHGDGKTFQPHIASQLKLARTQALSLADCRMTAEQYDDAVKKRRAS